MPLYSYVTNPFENTLNVKTEHLPSIPSELFHADSLRKYKTISSTKARLNFELKYADFYEGISLLMMAIRAGFAGKEEMISLMKDVVDTARRLAPYDDYEIKEGEHAGMMRHDVKHPGLPHLADAITFVMTSNNYGFVTVDPRIKYAARQHEDPALENKVGRNPYSGQIGEWKYIEKAMHMHAKEILTVGKGYLQDMYNYARSAKTGRKLTVGEVNRRAMNWRMARYRISEELL